MKRNLQTASIATVAIIIVILVFNLTRPHETPRYTITAIPRGELMGTAIKLDSKTGNTYRFLTFNANDSENKDHIISLWVPISDIDDEIWDGFKRNNETLKKLLKN